MAATGASSADVMDRTGYASVGAALYNQHATRTQDTAFAGKLSEVIVLAREA